MWYIFRSLPNFFGVWDKIILKERGIIMTYVMSDLHGDYENLLKMLQMIEFSDEDILYILGDSCDRGENASGIYLDLIERKNVVHLMGNHEKMALDALASIVNIDISDEEKSSKEIHESVPLEIWMENGGEDTLLSFKNLNNEQLCSIVFYMNAMPYFAEIEVNGREFVLVHAGFETFSPEKSLEDYEKRELIWARYDYDKNFYQEENKKVIVGHTPTFVINRWERPAKIYHGKGDVIAIDCGSVYRDCGGRLACLRLDDMKEFYV